MNTHVESLRSDPKPGLRPRTALGLCICLAGLVVLFLRW